MLERNTPAVAVAGQKLELSHIEGWLDGEGLPGMYLQGDLSRQTVQLEDELEVVAGRIICVCDRFTGRAGQALSWRCRY